jgi:hypothetical protein
MADDLFPGGAVNLLMCEFLLFYVYKTVVWGLGLL